MKNPTWTQTFDRWSQIVRHHRADQLARRFWYRMRDQLGSSSTIDDVATPAVRKRSPVAIDSVSRRLPTSRLSSGELDLLNVAYAVGQPMNWTSAFSSDTPLLARFHLQYHEYLLESATDVVVPAIERWLELYSHPNRTRESRIAWHAYCISRRIPIWMQLLQRRLPTAVASAMVASLAKQAQHLSRRFERDIGGNHLWENARALTLAGCFFEGDIADEWMRRGWSVLEDCLETQLLPWGEHYERSPMYQDDLANGLLELAIWSEPINAGIARECRFQNERMSSFLDAIRHPDGKIPLFGDSTFDGDRAGQPRGFASGWVGEYFVHRNEPGHFLIFDTGNVGPDDLPAHAHADLLNCEISRHGWRLLVDSGVVEYAGDRRSDFRKSSAHNVLTVDDVELADVWGSFRMGRRGKVLSRASGRVGDALWVRAEHNAYQALGVRVKRIFVIFPNNDLWSIHLALGSGSRKLTEYLHWHRDINWAASGTGFITDLGSGTVRWQIASNADHQIYSAMQAEKFSVEREHDVWKLSQQTALPGISAWMLTSREAIQNQKVELEPGCVVLSWNENGMEQRIRIPV